MHKTSPASSGKNSVLNVLDLVVLHKLWDFQFYKLHIPALYVDITVNGGENPTSFR